MLRQTDVTMTIIDLQEKLLPAIGNADRIIPNVIKLIRFAAILELPLLLTEQYPKGLGRTVDPVAAELPGVFPIEKTSFGCMGDEGFCEALARTGRRQLVIAGVETHVCVLQTALGAAAQGFEAFVVRDATGSRSDEEHLAGLDRLSRAGVSLVTTEMALFEILGKSDAPQFKKAIALIK